MARQDKKSYDLSEAEQRDLVTLIQQGKALPEKYRFILFEDKREVELVWNGKTRDVCTTVLPFQTLEHIDEPRVETKAQEDLFDSRGRQQRGWTNKLIWGCEWLRKSDRIRRRQKSGHGFCRLGAGSRADAARRSEPLTRWRGDTLNHGCKRGIFALTAMLTSFFHRQPLSVLRRR